MKQLFDQSSYRCSQLVTNAYSTSFSLGIKLFSAPIRPAIYAIYGFVRYADEIVDTFHDYDQATLFYEFQADYQKALKRRISLNPILNSFQEIVHKYELYQFVDDFMKRMEMDLNKKNYLTEEEYKNYIYGSADVIGLMCLRVFVNNNEQRFNELKPSAMRLGSAFQKVNFLRDIKADTENLGRSYFPNLDDEALKESSKKAIIEDIEEDFREAYNGIVQLPREGRLGVYIAYRYYLRLLKKLKRINSERIMTTRTRVSNPFKIFILMKGYVRYKLNLI